MLLSTNDGYQCDCCGRSYTRNFTYYSIDVRQIEATNNRFTVDRHSLVIFSLDACPGCMDHIKDGIRVNYVPTSIGVNCDLCKHQLRGTFTCYHCNVTKADVSADTGTLTCKRCRQPVQERGTCQCGSAEAVRHFSVTTDDNYLQFTACPADYQRLADAAGRIRQLAGVVAAKKKGE